MEQSKSVVAIGAHPDDVEFLCAGTLALLKERGWSVHLATMTPGDAGSTTLSREEISAVRREEARQAAALLEGTYDCMECNDLGVMYDKETLLKVIALLRRYRPGLVLAPSPVDYIVDHEMTSKLVQTACLGCTVKNAETEGLAACAAMPHLYYADAIEGKDNLGRPIEPTMVVDITSAIEMKEQMLRCHESQRSWLRAQHGVDEYLVMMRRMSQAAGAKVGCDYGEGFRQHLGHSYPQDDLLAEELGALVHGWG